MVKGYNEFINEDVVFSVLDQTNYTYNEIVDKVDEYFTDLERSKEDTDYYLEEIQDLYNSGGDVYRILFHFDEKFIDTTKLGDHWCIGEDIIDNFSNMLKDGATESLDTYIDENGKEQWFYDTYENDDLKAFMITATLPPNFINLDWSIGQFCALPNEFEVMLIDNPTKFKIKEING